MSAANIGNVLMALVPLILEIVSRLAHALAVWLSGERERAV